MTNPQVIASDPEVSAFVTANAGSGKTRTLVDRVARLLLRGARPEAILCVTYTKAAAAEMQRRLFDTLGGWAVMDNETLVCKLAQIEEQPGDLGRARALFARALETPGGLKIQTIHAFCEKLLRRFPLEAGVSPGFRVLEDQAARQVSAMARDDVAYLALAAPDADIGRAYGRLGADLDFRAFTEMFADFEAKRRALSAYIRACEETGGVPGDVWRRCGFDEPETPDDIRRAAVTPPAIDPSLWRAGARALEAGGKRDLSCAQDMAAVAETAARGEADFSLALNVFCTSVGEPAKWLDTSAVLRADDGLRSRLISERDRLLAAGSRAKSAKVAQDTIAVLMVAKAYVDAYNGRKAEQAGLDFGDLIERVEELLTRKADAAWVLFKLDGGLDHILLDEAQDTAPDQWAILRALSLEFFSGAGARATGRTTFAVGDEKQSIFSFQGAAPERFLAEAREYQQLVDDVGLKFVAPALVESYRSTPEVLGFVDAVFRDPAAREGLMPDAGGRLDLVEHKATRPRGAGAVELWPLETTEPAEEQDPWAPLDLEPPEGGTKKLARRIAREIKGAIARRDGVYDKAIDDGRGGWRPAQAGDFLILVRRRNALFQEIIRALKKEAVPVGGADRLKLSEHILFADLVALARFVLYPHDDLTLAALLRSPLTDIDEDGLYALAQPRSGSLWGELSAREDERPEFGQAKALLDWARQVGRHAQPFDFYGRLLARLDATGRSYRNRILTRMGREAEDALEAFMGEALAAEGRGARDLETFAAEMAASDIEVKREQEDGKGYVRVMTVHGAKGLEAPVVILPDLTTRAKPMGAPLMATQDGGFLWCSRKADDGEASARARQDRCDASDHESLRLLYVALTRARDRLVLCGVRRSDRKAGYEDASWWDYVGRAFEDAEIAAQVRELEDEPERIVRRFGFDPVAATSAVVSETAVPAAPAWTARAAATEPAMQRYASPSQLADTRKGPAPSPLDATAGGLGRYRRGDLIHRLLQQLPDVAPDLRRPAAERLLDRERDLTPEQRAEMIAAAFGVLEDDRFAEVFAPGSRAEVALAGAAPGLPKGLAVSGRLDRLLVTLERVLVADYKSNRPSPDRIEDADEAYLVQMAVYVAVLRAVFPGRRVEAALVWTDGPKLMPIPESLIAATLAELGGAG